MLRIKILVPLFLVFCATCLGQSLNCIANAGITPPVRAEGLTEPVGDLLVICSGGTPTAAGAPVPTVTIQIFLNTPVTSRCLESTSSVGCIALHSEALLLIDEPAPADQYGCPTNTCAGVGTGTGAGGYGPGTAGTPGNNKNVFQGIQTALNSITFLFIPIDPPGNGSGQRIIRITNVRANATFLGIPSDGSASVSITEVITSTPPNFMPISGLAIQAVGSVVTGMSGSVVGPPTFQQSASQNPGLAADPNSSGVSQFAVRFRELFSTAFKKRNIATSAAAPSALANQNDLTVGMYNTESGFYSNSLTLPSQLSPAGLADSGTRLMARFSSIPPGVSLFSNVSGTVTGGGAGAVRMVSGDANGAGPYTPVTGNSFGIAPIPIVNGAATAVYEVLDADPNSFATVDVPIYVAYASDVPMNMPGLGTATVSLSYAPVSTETTAVAAMVPRFTDSSTAMNAFTIDSLHCASLISSSISVGAIGGPGSAAVTTEAGCQWTPTTSDSWIALLPSGPSAGQPGSLNYSVAPNTLATPRIGTILIHFTGQPSMPDQAFTITQGGIPCVNTVSPATVSYPYWGGTGWITVYASSSSCPWTVSGGAPWLTVTSSVSGEGSRFITYSVTVNNGDSRTGTFTIGGRTVTITQAGTHDPYPVYINPVSGSGVTNTFNFVFSDLDLAGALDLGIVNVLINRALDGRNACYLAYDRPNNVLYLVGDVGGGLTGMVLNGSGSVGNSQCTVNGAGSFASAGGNELTLTLSITFNQSTFAGEKIIYTAARDIAQHNSGWTAMGIWSVPRLTPAFPSIVSVTPRDGGGNYNQFAVTYRDVSSSANLRTMQLLINSDLNGNQACYLGYDHAANVLYLVNDDNSGLLLPGIVPGSDAGLVQNSQCTLNGVGTGKTESGTDLTLYVALTFQPSFAGPKVVFTGVQTISNANSDWRALGFWQIPGF